MQLQEAKFVDKANVVTGKFTNDAGQKFAFEYCGESIEDDHASLPDDWMNDKYFDNGQLYKESWSFLNMKSSIK